MKEIKLSRGLSAMVDDEDYEFLNQWKWSAHQGGKTFYATRTIWNKGNRIKVRMHRLILNTPTDMQVDHIDHNGLNNQKNNIRNCNHQQNHFNINRYTKSKYHGVYYDRNYIKSSIQLNGKTIHIGNFKTEIDAAKAYDIKAKELFGEFAHINFK